MIVALLMKLKSDERLEGLNRHGQVTIKWPSNLRFETILAKNTEQTVETPPAIDQKAVA